MKPYEFPKLIIEEHEGFHVVRDDLLEGGSKRRFVDRMMRDEIENGIEMGTVYGTESQRMWLSWWQSFCVCKSSH